MRLNIASSETCPYNENGECGCTNGCGVDSICTLDHHPVFKGKFKQAFYGIIGPGRHVRRVHDAMKAINYMDGVYTIIVDGMSENDSIIEEINLFNEIKAADPTGDFTPLLLYYMAIARDSLDFEALQEIGRNVKTHQRNVPDGKGNLLHEGDDLVKLIEENEMGLFFLYVTDVGKPIYEYDEEECVIAPVEDVISATTKLAADYQILARNKIGHYDMHGSNILYKMRNGKLCLSIIDFGFGYAIEHGVRRNVLHNLFSTVHFDDIENTMRNVRHCDPPHYIMFVMCFGMLRRCLQQYNPPKFQDVEAVLNDMHYVAFSGDKLTAETLDMKNFQIFQDRIIEVYEIFYNQNNLHEIWKRVCTKSCEAIERYVNKTIDGMAQLSERVLAIDTRNRLPIAQKYRPDNEYTYGSKRTNAFTLIFDDFSMAYYDMESVSIDHVFLRKKFDEFSIASVCVGLLNDVCVEETTYQEQVQLGIQVTHFQKAFSSPYFFLHNDQSSVSMNTPSSSDPPSKRKYEMSGPEQFAVSRPKRRQPSPPPEDLTHPKPYAPSSIKSESLFSSNF